MARKKNGHAIEEDVSEFEDEHEEMVGQTNCTDETRREFYRKALMAKIGLEAAQAAAKTKNAEYRNVLKDAKKAGCNSTAIADALAARFMDEDTLVLELREKLKMLDLSGVVPRIVDKILGRLDIEEPTRNEQHQMTVDRAYDDGAFAGREGAPRDANTHPAGSDLYDAWDRGYLLGQAAIAAEMMPAEPPAVIQ